jgi:hypothetical protein
MKYLLRHPVMNGIGIEILLSVSGVNGTAVSAVSAEL